MHEEPRFSSASVESSTRTAGWTDHIIRVIGLDWTYVISRTITSIVSKTLSPSCLNRKKQPMSISSSSSPAVAAHALLVFSCSFWLRLTGPIRPWLLISPTGVASSPCSGSGMASFLFSPRPIDSLTRPHRCRLLNVCSTRSDYQTTYEAAECLDLLCS